MGIKSFFKGIGPWISGHKSDLKMWLGTGGVIGGTVLLCKETLDVAEKVREYREEKQKLIEAEAEKKEIRKLKAKTAGKVALTMAPGAALEGAGLASMWSGYSDAKAVIAGLGGVVAGLQEFIDKYRAGVREKYGEEADEELAYNFRTEEVVIKEEDGTERTETVRIYPHDAEKMPSMYARYFCYGEAEGAERSFDYNDKFLSLQVDAANRYLKAKRFMILNDFYALFGFKPSKAGNHVGWVYDPDNPEGDNQIKARIRVVFREKLNEFGEPDGYEKVHIIDPNVDGMIEDKLLRMGLIDA